MKKLVTRRYRILRIFLGVLFFVVLGCYVLVQRIPVREPERWGVTFAHQYARSFGLSWVEVYEALLQDMNVRNLRIPIYWPEVEHRQGEWYFNDYDYQISRADDVGARVIVVVGRKAPRWPECHEASWALSMSEEEKQDLILNYIKTVINRYRSSPSIVAWQVENEPFLPFGICPPLQKGFLDREIALVRSLDPSRPVVITDSGELSIWIHAMKRADIFGTTMYRTIYNQRIGYFTYPLPPSFFRLKRAIAEIFAGEKSSIVIELQAEPWGPRLIPDLSREEQSKSFDLMAFKNTVAYAGASGFDEFYLWGAEWWYWLKVSGDPAIWDYARGLFYESHK